MTEAARNALPHDALEDELALIDTSLLPPLMRRLVKLIGLRHTVALIAARPGVRVYVGVQPERCGVLREIMPFEAVEKLCHEMPGETLELPTGKKLLAQLRRHSIRSMRARGLSQERVATAVGLTRRWVRNIEQQIHSLDGDGAPRTGDLFDSDATGA